MMRPVLTVLAALLFAGALASPLPEYLFVTADGKAEVWLAPDLGELGFDVLIMNADPALARDGMEQASATLLRPTRC